MSRPPAPILPIPHAARSGAHGARTLALATPSVRGEVALLTDGTSEAGRALALGLASLGMDVALVHAPGQGQEARALGEALLARGRRVLLLAADSGPEEALELAIARTRELLGRLDLLIDNAGLDQKPAGAGLDRGAGSVRVEVQGLAVRVADP